MKICYNKKLINDVKRKSSILAITLVKYDGPVQITSNGDFRIRCVFHNDHKPSMILYTKDNKFKCLSTNCMMCGDIIDLTKKLYNLDFISAVQTLAYAFHVSLPETENERVDYISSKEMRKSKQSEQYNKLIIKSYQKTLKK